MRRITQGSVRDASFGRETSIELVVYKQHGYAFNERNPNWVPSLEHNEAFLKAQIMYLSQRLQEKKYLFLNDALEAFGFERRPDGQVAGWHVEDGGLDITYKNADLVDSPGEKRLWITLKPHGVIVNRI